MRKWIVGLGVLLLGIKALAAPIDVAKSSIIIVFSHMGVPIEAQFKRFSGDVQFAAAAPANTRAALTVDVASFALGDPEHNKEGPKREWCNADKSTNATV